MKIFHLKEEVSKKRLQARSTTEPSLKLKLAKDRYTLFRAYEGEYTEDLCEVVSTRPSRKQTNMDQSHCEGSQSDNSMYSLLQETIVAMCRDMQDIKKDTNDILKERDKARDRAVKLNDERKYNKKKLIEKE